MLIANTFSAGVISVQHFKTPSFDRMLPFCSLIVMFVVRKFYANPEGLCQTIKDLFGLLLC